MPFIQQRTEDLSNIVLLLRRQRLTIKLSRHLFPPGMAYLLTQSTVRAEHEWLWRWLTQEECVWRKLNYIWDDALFVVRVPDSEHKQTKSWPRVTCVWSLQACLLLSVNIYSAYRFFNLACSIWCLAFTRVTDVLEYTYEKLGVISVFKYQGYYKLKPLKNCYLK